jgi:hypothetical protein
MAVLSLGRRTSLLALCLLLPSCNVLDLIKPPPREPARLVLPVSDTAPVAADATVPLVVQVLGIGGLARGVSVQFGLSDSARTLQLRLLASLTDSGQANLSVLTGPDGTATAYVRFGGRPGRAVVRISVPSLGTADSVAYTLGLLMGVVNVSPSDTAVSPGDSFFIHVTSTVFIEPAFASLDPSVVTATSAGLVRAVAVGRTSIAITGVNPIAKAAVSVVPNDTLAGVIGDSVLLVSLNGRNPQVVKVLSAAGAAWLRWAPSRTQLLFQNDSGLRLMDLAGTVQRVPGLDTLGNAGQTFEGSFSFDGGWVYLAAVDLTDYSTHIWRVRVDGSGLERLEPQPFDSSFDYEPSPSPDGLRVAMASVRGASPATVIRVLDIGTRTVTNLGVSGWSPRWSPTGQQIAYLDKGYVNLINPDGTGQRRLNGPAYGWLDWSIDGAWIVARWSYPGGPSGVDLLNTRTGQILPLSSFFGRLMWPVWKP